MFSARLFNGDVAWSCYSFTMASDSLKSQEELARAVARTKGQNSEAAKALRELEVRRDRGEDVIVFPLRGRWLVGPQDEVAAEVSNRHADVERKRTTTLRKKERDAAPASARRTRSA